MQGSATMPQNNNPLAVSFKSAGVILLAVLAVFSLPTGATVLGLVEHESTQGGNYDVDISPDGAHVYAMELQSRDSYNINVYSYNTATDDTNDKDSSGGGGSMDPLLLLIIGLLLLLPPLWFRRSASADRLDKKHVRSNP
jgi:hypothetical protein